MQTKSSASGPRRRLFQDLLDAVGDMGFDVVHESCKELGLRTEELSDDIEELVSLVAIRVAEQAFKNAVDEVKVIHGMTEEELLELATKYSDLDEFITNLPESIKNYNKLEEL